MCCTVDTFNTKIYWDNLCLGQDLDLSDPEVLARRIQEEEAWISAKSNEGSRSRSGWFEAKLAKVVVDNIRTNKQKMERLDDDIKAMKELQVSECLQR